MELMDGAPAGSTYASHKTGWIQLELFTQWLRHFIECVKPSQESLALLILDGHASHTKNLEAINLARQHFITIISLPPHCTHRMQPLDVAFMKLLSTYYDSETQMWLRSHRIATEFQITSIFAKAYLRTASLATAVNGYEKTGIWPVNRNVFEEWEFKAAETTEMPAPESEITIQSQHPPVASTSSDTPMLASDISPYPVAKERVNRTRRRKGFTAVLTSSSYKQSLSEKPEKNEKTKGKSKLKKKLFSAENKKSKQTGATMTSALMVDNDTPCIYCTGLFSEDGQGEQWVMCKTCRKWVHTECAGADEDEFKCDLCIDSD